MSAPADAFESSGDADDEMHKELDDLQYQAGLPYFQRHHVCFPFQFEGLVYKRI